MGLAFVLRPGLELQSLTPFRDCVCEIRRGTIGAADDERALVIVLFTGPPEAHGLGFPAALPLVAAGPGTIGSHVTGGNESIPAGGTPRIVQLWWAGAAHRIALDMLDRVPLGTLWAMPEVTLRPASQLALRSTPTQFRAGAADPDAAVIPSGGGALRRALPSTEQGEPPFADLRSVLSQRRTFAAALRENLPGRPQPGTLPRVGTIGAVIALVLAIAGGGGAGAPWVIAILLGSFFVGGLTAAVGGTQGRAAAPRGPGLFDNLLGWLRWNNPLGSSLRRELDRRVRRVDNLVARGMIDDALRLALRLGSGAGGTNLPRRYPNQLPAARARLDFDVAAPGFMAPLLSEAANWHLRQSYVQLAQRLERERDYRRAAFIHSQLLDNHAEAALVLEKGGMLDEAAQLALGAKVDPVLTIRLLYASGKQDAALALARRAGCFDQLAQDSRGKHPDFHAHVVKAWTDLLVDTGQTLRALQVTDELARELEADQALLSFRRRWLVSAMQADDGAGFPAEIVARAVLTGEALDPAFLTSFPKAPLPTNEPLFALALGALQEQARRDEGDGEELIALLDALLRLAAPKSPEQARFWEGVGQALIEVLTRALLRVASVRLAPADIGAIQKLLRMADVKVLAADVGKLSKLHAAGTQPARDWVLPPPAALAPRVLAGCLLTNGMILAWRETETLDLFDRHGAPIWRQRLSDVTALVPVGGSANVLIVQRERDGRSRVTRFHAPDRRFHPVGVIDLVAHHDVTSENAWLVQVGGDFGALDLAKLCAKEPAFEFLWSCALTQRVQGVAFLHGENAASWITLDTTPERLGLAECWRLESSGKLTTSVCLTGGVSGLAVPPTQWAWIANSSAQAFQAISPPAATMWSQVWSEEGEVKARQQRQLRSKFDGFDSFVPCDFGRAAVRFSRGESSPDTVVATEVLRAGQAEAAFTLRHEAQAEIACLARAPAVAASTRGGKGRKASAIGKALFADRAGRLILVDPELLRVSLF